MSEVVERTDLIKKSERICFWLFLVSRCSSGMKSMCLCTYDVSVALFGEECHFPGCNYTHTATEDVMCDT